MNLPIPRNKLILKYGKGGKFMIRLRKVVTTVSLGLMAIVALPSMAVAAPGTQVVTETDLTRQAENTPPTDDWVIYSRNAGAAAFRDGPATPPLNDGSLELTTPTGADKVTIFNYDHTGTRLDAIDALGYSTYRSAGSLQQVAALNLQVDIDGDGNPLTGFTTLVFEPVYNTDQGAVESGTWQTWDGYKGGDAIWWSSNAIPGAPNRDTFVSWNTLVAANPNAVILGAGINQGSGNPVLTTAVDKFTVGHSGESVTYDFQRVAPKPVSALSKDECKNGGWKNFQTQYKNQGDCVSSVASQGRAGGNPNLIDSVVNFFRSAF